MTKAEHRRPGPEGSARARTIEALTSISEAVYVLDAEDQVTWLNTAAEQLVGRPAEQLVGRHVFAEFPRLRDTPLGEAHRRARVDGLKQQLEVFNDAVDRWFEVNIYPNGQSLVVFFRDVHERRTLDEEQAAESSLIRAVLNALPSRTAILDGDGMILTTNAAWARGTAVEGRPFESRTGANYLDAIRAAADAGDADARAAVDGLEAVLARRAPSFSLDYAVRPVGRTGDPTWWHLQAFPVDDGPRIVVTHTDITDRVTAEQRAAWQARHDHLTALPNRAGLHEAIAAALADDVGGRVTVLYMDVDGFKQVNDSLGHDAGDLLLRELAARLSHRTRPTDVVGRLGGDEFVVVARAATPPGGGAGHPVPHRLRRPFELAGTRLPLTMSIGIASSDPAHSRPEDLLRDADPRCTRRRPRSDNHLSFTPALRSELADRWQIAAGARAAELGRARRALASRVVEAAGGEVTGCEALLRWQHPDRGLMGPADFVPVAEENGLIVPITRWLLGAALAQRRAWSADGLELTVGVNVSAVHLSTGTLVEDVLEALARRVPRRLPGAGADRDRAGRQLRLGPRAAVGAAGARRPGRDRRLRVRLQLAVRGGLAAGRRDQGGPRPGVRGAAWPARRRRRRCCARSPRSARHWEWRCWPRGSRRPSSWSWCGRRAAPTCRATTCPRRCPPGSWPHC